MTNQTPADSGYAPVNGLQMYYEIHGTGRPEHAVETFRLLGGGVIGDLAGLPRSWLAVLPGTTTSPWCTVASGWRR